MTATEFGRATRMAPQSAMRPVLLRFAGLVLASAAGLAIFVTAALAVGAVVLSKLTP